MSLAFFPMRISDELWTSDPTPLGAGSIGCGTEPSILVPRWGPVAFPGSPSYTNDAMGDRNSEAGTLVGHLGHAVKMIVCLTLF